MKNRYEPSNFELKQEIKRLEKSIYFYKNVEELKQNQTLSNGEVICFWILVALFLVSLFIILCSAQINLVRICTTLLPVYSFAIGLIIPDIRHKL